MKREDYEGLEYDWFAVDADLHVAVFSTAGWGEIPSVVLEANPPWDDSETERILAERLAPTGRYLPEGRGPGTCEEWKLLAERGIYVFDWRHWSGPYERIVAPSVPVRLAAIPDELQRPFSAVKLDTICFAEVTRTLINGVPGRSHRAAQQRVRADGQRQA